jgi:predicted metal-binding protein
MKSLTSNIRQLPLDIKNNTEMVQEALNLGCNRAKVIWTKTIAIGTWGRLQCQYGCSHYGKLHTCPPHSPNSDELGEILVDYQRALLLHATPKVNMMETAVSLENNFKTKGFYKAFGLCSRACDLCETCTIDSFCKHPDKARPTLQGCGVDVQRTVFNNGWGDVSPNQPCADMQNIGMVLLD